MDCFQCKFQSMIEWFWHAISWNLKSDMHNIWFQGFWMILNCLIDYLKPDCKVIVGFNLKSMILDWFYLIWVVYIWCWLGGGTVSRACHGLEMPWSSLPFRHYDRMWVSMSGAEWSCWVIVRIFFSKTQNTGIPWKITCALNCRDNLLNQ